MQEKRVLITGKSGTLSIAIAQWLQSKNNMVINQLGLRDDEWKKQELGCYDVVVHVAGVTPQNTTQAETFYTVNYQLTEELALKAKAEGVKQFVYLSSMAVYGLEQQMDINMGTVKEATPCKPKSDYGKSKFMAEESLKRLSTNEFQVAIVRVPSIYGPSKTEYLDQYRYLSQKLPVIPNAFHSHYKSAIYVENLCELIYLLVKNESQGVFCPDDGQYTTVDYCAAIEPIKKKSKILGFLLELLLKGNDRILDYYGTICYSDELTNVFEGKYRVCNLEEAVKKSYEK